MDDMHTLAEQLPIADNATLSESEASRLKALSRHNASQPICSLPPEILANILGHLRDASPVYLGWIHPSILKAQKKPVWWHRLRWIAATYVCRHFRNVALDYPDLWSTITSCGHCETWSLELLKRSKDAAITLDMRTVGVQDPNPERFIEQLKDPRNIRRIRHVKTTDTSLSAASFLHELFENPAPMLESLDIHRCSCSGSGDETVTLPRICYQSHAPRLREVTLFGCSFYWSSFSFPSLTHLDLQRGRLLSDGPSVTGNSVQPNSSTDAFVECLRSLPLLRTLVLQNALPYVPPAGSGMTTSISLPNLEKLRLEDSISSCSWFLGSLHIPFLNDMLEIRAVVDIDFDLINLTGLLRFISSYVPNIGIPISELQVWFASDELRVDITPAVIWPDGTMSEENVNGTYQMPNSLYLSLSFILPTLHELDSFVDRYSLIHQVLKALPLSDLRLLTFTVDLDAAQLYDFLDVKFWREFYGACASVTGIQVQGPATVALLPFLATRNPPHWKLGYFAEPRAPLFPALKDLSVGEVGSERLDLVLDCCVEDGSRASTADERQGRQVEFIHQCLASRVEEAAFLERLYVDVDEDLYCLDKEYEDLLRTVAKEVESGIFSW